MIFFRLAILKQKLAKEIEAKDMKDEKKKKEQELEKEREVELAFLKEEESEIRQENNEQIKTKRLIDNVFAATDDKVNEEVCILLSNYRGKFNLNIEIYINKNNVFFFKRLFW